jgi:hypothetical protein
MGSIRFLWGDVTIKMQPGQTLRHSFGGETDEGWERTSVEFRCFDQHVEADVITDGADCDGRLTNFHSLFWDRSKRWDLRDSSKFDQFAQLEGY